MSFKKSEHTVGEMTISGLDVGGVTTENVSAFVIKDYPHYQFAGIWGDGKTMVLYIDAHLEKDDVYDIGPGEEGWVGRVAYLDGKKEYTGRSGTITITEFNGELQQVSVYVDVLLGRDGSEESFAVRIKGAFKGFEMHGKDSPEALALSKSARIS
jgi:hypothetical protein